MHPSSITATVAAVAPDAGTPTGSVTFSVDGTTVGSANLSGGVATLNHTVPSGKTQHVAAVYAGDADFTGSSGSTARHDPKITATVKSAKPKRHGWYRRKVTVTFHCTATSAPLTSGCPTPVTRSHNAAGQSVTRTVTATNGGAATAVVSGINIDTVKPHVSIGGVKSGATYDGTAPKPTCVGHDGLSGVFSCTLHFHGNGQQQTLTATATDKAGNVASTHVSFTVLRYFIKHRSPNPDGSFTTKLGHSYEVGAVATHRPTYYLATPATSGRPTPFERGPQLKSAGHHIWLVRIFVKPAMSHHRNWNVGVKVGHTMHVIHLRVI